MKRTPDQLPIPVASGPSSNRSGFSLIELLMVLSLLLVFASMTLPGLLRWQNSVGMERALSVLQVQVQETRLSAIRTGMPWKLVLPQDGRAGGRHQSDQTAIVEKRHQFDWPAGISCRSADSQASETVIVCHPDGTVTGCTLRFNDVHGQLTVLQINRLTGAVSIVSSLSRNAAPERENVVQTGISGPTIRTSCLTVIRVDGLPRIPPTMSVIHQLRTAVLRAHSAAERVSPC